MDNRPMRILVVESDRAIRAAMSDRLDDRFPWCRVERIESPAAAIRDFEDNGLEDVIAMSLECDSAQVLPPNENPASS